MVVPFRKELPSGLSSPVPGGSGYPINEKYLDLKTEYVRIENRWGRGVAVNMRPCQGRDRRFESGRPRQLRRTTSMEVVLFC